MTGRSVDEWIGRTPDSRPPPRVLLRIFEANHGIDYLSGRKIHPGEPWQADHVIAIINGGENRESNMRPVLIDSHKVKTKADVAEKAKVAAIAKRHVGITKPTGKIASARFPGKKAPRTDRLPVPARTRDIYRRPV